MSDRRALQVLLKSPISHEMVTHVVNTTLKVIQCKKSKTIAIPSPPSSPCKTTTVPLPSLMTFITRLIRHTNVYTGTFLSTLVYLQRISVKLPKNSEGSPCTLHRIFLACLILSSKFHNDSSPKNAVWAKYTDGLFQTEDVNLMERQLLNLLNWDLTVSEPELIYALSRFVEPIRMDIEHASFTRRVVSEYTRKQQQIQLKQQEQQHSQDQYQYPQTQSHLLSPLKSSVKSPRLQTYSRQQLYTCPNYTAMPMSAAPSYQLPNLPPSSTHQSIPSLAHSRSSSASSINSTFSLSGQISRSVSAASSLSSQLSSPHSDVTWEYNANHKSPTRLSSWNETLPVDMNGDVDGSVKLQQLPAYFFKFDNSARKLRI